MTAYSKQLAEANLRRKLQQLKTLKTSKQRGEWAENLSAEDLGCLSKCSKQLKAKPSRYLTKRSRKSLTKKSKETLKKRNKLLKLISGGGSLRARRKRLSKYLKQKGGSIIASK